MTEEERIREQLHELICIPPRKEDCPYSPYESSGKHYSPFVRNPICDECLKDKILSLVEIRADDQSLPKGLTVRLNLPHLEHYLYGQEALEEAGFIKVMPKEELPQERRVPYYASGEWKGEYLPSETE